MSSPCSDNLTSSDKPWYTNQKDEHVCLPWTSPPTFGDDVSEKRTGELRRVARSMLAVLHPYAGKWRVVFRANGECLVLCSADACTRIGPHHLAAGPSVANTCARVAFSWVEWKHQGLMLCTQLPPEVKPAKS